MKEEWKPVKNYEKYYEVSSFGRVKSLRTGKIRLARKITGSKTRYAIYLLYKNGKRRSVSIHRLVAEAFLPNPDNYPIINHKDENPFNNRVDNLEWCTALYNINYGTGKQRKAASKRNRNYKKVAQLDSNGNLIKIWKNAREASESLNISHSGILIACNKGYYKDHNRVNIHSCHGYKWQYVV